MKDQKHPRRDAELQPACEWCGVRVFPSRTGTWKQVTGWVQNREGGGAHGVTRSEPTGRYGCEGCVALVRRGINPDSHSKQATLL